jgi:hypothetical protein
MLLFCGRRYTDKMDELRINHNLHLFVDTTNASNAEVFDSINMVCKQLDAQVLVMAARKKVCLLCASTEVTRLVEMVYDSSMFPRRQGCKPQDKPLSDDILQINHAL